ncbi:fumarylacetoacetate hydrolase family protein [Faecalicatena acetigenes]|uniref:Fumarylacetoacetate hydrolase family protein n=1 Tax=Faecalicatena acetigenes TaxID=2981790 RepID=A0ABT2TAA1_9FIRM|nr:MULTISPECIES: fumarylacetoacetate hydrolase family protein [Lachnospiraceae]MCU6747170.1 fumarylacetoacetate hydrolase family protein [Faecalicatena acetigenes]SCH69374.1 Ureidoglycolate lyase [uncultured Clostridium sp.]
MKLCTFKTGREQRVGVLMDNGKILDVNYGYAAALKAAGKAKPQERADVMTPPCMIGIIESGEEGKECIREAMAYASQNPDAAGPEGETLIYAPEEITYMAPIPAPSKIFSIAINNRQKYEIADLPDGPKHPYYFIKVPTCVVGPYDTLEIPKEIGNVGSESEMAFVIAKKGRFIDEKDAESYVYGYTVHNDLTAHWLRDNREWIVSKRSAEEGGDKRLTYAGRYKCYDSFAPMGPYLVTADEIEDVNNLDIDAWLDGEHIQTGNTRDMFFKIPYLISYLSGAHTLCAGDIVSWGTVQGGDEKHAEKRKDIKVKFQHVDLGKGKVLTTEVEGIGKIANPIKVISDNMIK